MRWTLWKFGLGIPLWLLFWSLVPTQKPLKMLLITFVVLLIGVVFFR